MSANRTGVDELPQNPELADLFTSFARAIRLSIRTHTIAKVDVYYPATQKVDVTVQILEVVKDAQASTSNAPNKTKTLPAIQLKDIPVAWMRTSSGYVTLPLSPGDTGELHIQDRDPSQWARTGLPTDPVSSFVAMMAGAVFHPNLFFDGAPIVPPTDTSAAVIECDAIKLGRLATLAAARVTDPTQAAASMSTWITQVTAAIIAMAAPFNAPVAPMSSLGPGAVVPPVPPTDFGLILSGSAKTKVE